jgi:hypothetical protein
MRACPEYILKMVREVDRSLSVVWDAQDAAWYLVSGGERLFALDHLDGTRVRNIDGCGGEVLEILRRSDTHRTGRAAFRRRGQLLERRRRDRLERDCAGIKDETRGEARNVARWMRQGHTPRTGAVFAGVTKR